MNEKNLMRQQDHQKFTGLFAILLLTVCVLACGVNTSFAQSTTVREGDKLDAVIGVVGKYPIYKSSIEGKLQLFLLQHSIVSMPDDSLMLLRKQILDGEIDEKVMLAKADQDSIVVTEAEVDDRLDQQIKMYQRQLGSADAVEKQFGKSISELKASPDLRQRARESLLIEQERYRAIPGSSSISRHDVEEFYRQYKDSLPVISEEVQLATIIKYVKVQTNQRERSKAFALSLIDSLKHGADFATLARRYSQHATAKDGGDFGAFYPRGTFLPDYEEVAFKLKAGEVSDVVETDQGFFIIKMIERRGEEVHLAEILIKPNASGADEDIVRNQLVAIRDSAIHGADFSRLAIDNSDDAETKVGGGDLGRLHLEDLAIEQREVVDSLKPGEISMPLHIQFSKTLTGFQIVKLVQKIAPHPASLTADYRELEAYALQWKQAHDMQAFLERARGQVYKQISDLRAFY